MLLKLVIHGMNVLDALEQQSKLKSKIISFVICDTNIKILVYQ